MSRILGEAVRISVQERNKKQEEETEEEDNTQTPTANNIRRKDSTPTANIIRNYEFDAPKFHDFSQEAVVVGEEEFGLQVTQDPDMFDCPEDTPKVKKVSIRKHVMRSAKKKQDMHKMILRKRKKKIKPTTTIPKPFKFGALATRYINTTVGPSSPFVSMINRVRKFETQTPERFKQKPKQLKRVLQMQKLTLPQSPKLTTRLRAKATKPLKSTTEIVEEEMKSILPFKANPINHKILKQVRQQDLPVHKLTIPQSPMITKPKPKLVRKVEKVVIKANPISHLKTFVPIVEHRKLPIPEYHLPGDEIYERKKHMLQQLEARQKEKLAHEREFRANPLKSDKVIEPNQPFKINHIVKITEPQPFLLETDKRGVIYQKEFEEKVQKANIIPAFAAQPLPNDEPFIPQRSGKEITAIVEFYSHSDVRASEREKFEEEQRLRKQEEEEYLKQLDDVAKENEVKEINRMRKERVHKARPVKHFKGVEVKPSDKKLTEPMTPMFARHRK